MKNLVYLIIGLMLCINISSSQAQDAVINILHINDTHGNLQPGGGRDVNLKAKSGGIARAASVIGYANLQDPETLLLHAGDYFVGDLTWYLFYGVPELAILKSLELDAITIGNHEFDATTPGLVGILEQTIENTKDIPGDINFLSANLIAKEPAGVMLKEKIKERIIKEVHGVKVGIFGMTSPMASVTSLSLPEIEIDTRFLEIAQEQVDSLKANGCKVIIFLSHLGMNLDKIVAANVTGIHLIVGSHDHRITETAEAVQNQINTNETTYIVQAGAFYQNIGNVQITVTDGEFSGLTSSIINLDSSIPEEPTVVAMIDELIAGQPDEVKMMFDTQIAQCEEDFSEFVPNPTVEGNKSTSVGCLVADAFKAWGGTDIGFTTSGLTSQMLYAGPLVGNDVFRMLGYGVNENDGVGYQMRKFHIKGKHLDSAVKYALGMVFDAGDDEFLPQVSGMEIVYYTNDEKELKILSIMINEEPLDLERTYSISTSIFVETFVEKMLGLPIEPYVGVEDISDFQVVMGYVIGQEILVPYTDIDCKRVVAPVRFNDTPSKLRNNVVFPNPAKDAANIELTIEKPGVYSFDVFNIADLKEIHIGESYFEVGDVVYPLNLSILPSGNYLIRIRSNDSIVIGKLVILK